MLKRRLIPMLYLRHDILVRSERFRRHLPLGRPVHQVERYNHWDVDELIVIDITPCDDPMSETPRVDAIIPEVARSCFMPLTFGGQIRELETMRRRLRLGADKVSLNRQALADPAFIAAAAHEFGSQAVVVSIDAARTPDGRYEVVTNGGRVATGRRPEDWAREAEDRGAGEILLTAVDRDGTAAGYDIGLVRRVADAVNIPVIAAGGAGTADDVVRLFQETRAAAAAAGNLFFFTELSYAFVKERLKAAGIDVR